ncbi:glucodextranase DOMON-like domain-containing protein [Thermus amyloliquefaciens]|uniref:glucodextranase DOMON-like domain-containing protein n=1 Tax=Thermus amyloliquefaciens TaxID=1449080 RepID=UPI00056DA7AE|nr:glucodextranase DOMON-like domain-containing protein [Thermus amyloliquefaciens]
MLFLFQDPLGDDKGLAYLYPQAALYREAGEGYADLLALAGEAREGRLVLKVRLARYPNPLEGPLGFSLATVVLWLDTGEGGEEALLPGLATPRGQGWEAAYVLTGFGGEKRTPSGERVPVRVWREGEWVVLDTGIPPGPYGHYGAVGLFDPFAPWYLRPTSPEGGPWTLGAPPGSPPAVDLLAEDPMGQVRAYQEGVLPPLKRPGPTLRRESLLAFALGGVSLLLAFLLRKA